MRSPRRLPALARTLVLGAALAATVAAAPAARAQGIASLDLVGQATFDAAAPLKVSTRTNGANATTTVGGLSGLAYDAARGVYYAISDDRGNLARPGENIDPRFYTLRLNLGRTAGGAAVFGNQDVTFDSYTTLLNGAGNPYPFGTGLAAGTVGADTNIDPEDIALSADGSGVYIISEGDKANSNASVIVPAFVNRYGLDGALAQTLSVPAAYQNTPSANTASGPRNNAAFESLTGSGNTLLTAVEGPLFQDGPPNTASTDPGVLTRLLAFDATTGNASGEFFYRLDRIREDGSAFETAGLVDLLAVGDGSYLALERSFTVGGALGGGLKGDGTTAPATGYSAKLYSFSLTGIAGGGIVQKTEVLDLNTLGIALDNVEGIEFGARLADGRRTLIIVADDNFSAANGNGAGTPGQFTQFIVLGVNDSSAAPEPGALLLAATGLPMLGMAIRRRRAGK